MATIDPTRAGEPRLGVVQPTPNGWRSPRVEHGDLRADAAGVTLSLTIPPAAGGVRCSVEMTLASVAGAAGCKEVRGVR